MRDPETDEQYGQIRYGEWAIEEERRKKNPDREFIAAWQKDIARERERIAMLDGCPAPPHEPKQTGLF